MGREQARNAAEIAGVLATLILLAATPVAAAAWECFVAPDGNDANPGTEEKPFATLERARDAVRDYRREAGDSAAAATVSIAGGSYELEAPFALTALDSGTPEQPVTYRASTPWVALSGGRQLSGWTLHDEKQGIWKASARGLAFRQLYVDGRPALRARRPNRDGASHRGPYFRVQSYDKATKTVRVRAADIGDAATAAGVELAVMPHWYHHRLIVDTCRVEGATAVITPRESARTNAFTKNAGFYRNMPYHLENAYAFLDAPGEWFLDPAEDTVYYIPRPGEDLATALVTAPATDILLTVTGTAEEPVHDVHFEGLTFEYTGWQLPSEQGIVATQGCQVLGNIDVPAAIRLEYAERITFRGNVIRNCGATGMQLIRGVRDSQLIGNGFVHIAANGLHLAVRKAGEDARDWTERIRIADNYIADTGMVYSNGQGMLASFVRELTIEHNELENLPYTGMQIGNQTGGHHEVGMHDNLIRGNYVHHVMQIHDDGGGIYTLGRQRGTRITGNRVADIVRSPWAASYPVAGIYLDNYSEYIRVEGNLVTHVDRPYYVQTGIGARNNTILPLEAAYGIEAAHAGIKQRALLPPRTGSEIPASTMLLNGCVPEGNDGGIMVPRTRTSGEASFVFGGRPGTYTLEIGYAKENDGVSTYVVSIGDRQIATWKAALGKATVESAVQIVEGVELHAGDTIRVSCQRSAMTHARLRQIALRRQP